MLKLRAAKDFSVMKKLELELGSELELRKEILTVNYQYPGSLVFEVISIPREPRELFYSCWLS